LFSQGIRRNPTTPYMLKNPWCTKISARAFIHPSFNQFGLPHATMRRKKGCPLSPTPICTSRSWELVVPWPPFCLDVTELVTAMDLAWSSTVCHDLGEPSK
jgi:hypothetical protein